MEKIVFEIDEFKRTQAVEEYLYVCGMGMSSGTQKLVLWIEKNLTWSMIVIIIIVAIVGLYASFRFSVFFLFTPCLLALLVVPSIKLVGYFGLKIGRETYASRESEYFDCQKEEIFIDRHFLVRRYILMNGHRDTEKYDILMFQKLKQSESGLTFTVQYYGEDLYERRQVTYCQVFPDYCVPSVYEEIRKLMMK